MKKRSWLIIAITIIAICACAFVSLRFFVAWAWGEIRNMPKQANPLDSPPIGGGEHYDINPSTILTDISNGRLDIYSISEGPYVPKHPSGSFAWSSADYFAIAKAHHLYLTGEPASGEWKLFAPGDFQIDQCRDDMQGFDAAKIIFYKRKAKSYPVTYMEISPLREVIYSAYKEYIRIPDGDTAIENFLIDPDASFQEALSTKGSMNAERVLQIAEEAGGAEMRQRLSNTGCRIHIAYFEDQWIVWYHWDTRELAFTLSYDISADGSYKRKEGLELCERAICP